jgi:hypothetical protein
MRYNISWFRDILVGLFRGLTDVGLFSSTVELSGFLEYHLPE